MFWNAFLKILKIFLDVECACAFPLTDYKISYFCIQFSSILYLKASCRLMSHTNLCEISCDFCFGD